MLATVAAFSSSFAGAFVFDDDPAIVQNRTIRQLWPIWKPLCPPSSGVTVNGRPLLNLSLAINYAVSGYQIWSYHATNLAIHLLAALLLFGIVRRTLVLPTMRDRWGAAAIPVALVIALLWAVHPLQTESVTYIIQRAESLVGLFYLLTLYCFIRGEGADIPYITKSSPNGSQTACGFATFWYFASVSACLLGMASKEVMVSAPLVVLLYDRTFCAGSFREAWRRRHGFYLALAGAWLVLGWLLIRAGNLRSTADLEPRQFTWWSYLLTQPGVIVHYLRLVAWPSPLCLEYGWPPAQNVDEVLFPVIPVVALLVLTLWALAKRPAWGFLAHCFFAVLAPTSSFLPLGQAAFEHRMYLPLAAVVTGLVVGAWFVGRWLVDRGTISRPASLVLGGLLAMCASIACGTIAFHRNLDYASELSIWEDTVAKAPDSPRAHNNLGAALVNSGQLQKGIDEYWKALEIDPVNLTAHNGLGSALVGCGRGDEAIAHCRKALEIHPDNAELVNNLGAALASRGKIDEAVVQYEKALELKPDCAQAHNNLGSVLFERGRIDDAIDHFEKALASRPDYAEAHNNLAAALLRLGTSRRGSRPVSAGVGKPARLCGGIQQPGHDSREARPARRRHKPVPPGGGDQARLRAGSQQSRFGSAAARTDRRSHRPVAERRGNPARLRGSPRQPR